MSSYKISIIIPAFNEEKNIAKILMSVFEQKYRNWEVIVVDDGSQDDTGKICKDYQRLYSNFKYVFKSNSGVSDARNLGLKYVTGDYVCFWDADDRVEKDYLYNMVKAINRVPSPTSTIFVAGCTIDYYSKKKKSKSKIFDINEQILSKQKIIESFAVQHEKYRLELWNKIFPVAIIKNKKFKSQFILGEDFEFFTQCLKDINYLVTVNDVSYHYQVDFSQMKHSMPYSMEVKREQIIKKNLKDMGIKDDVVNKFYFRRLLITAYTLLSYSNYSNKKEIAFVLKELRKEKVQAFKPYANYKKAQWIMLILIRLHSDFAVKEYFELKRKIKH